MKQYKVLAVLQGKFVEIPTEHGWTDTLTKYEAESWVECANFYVGFDGYEIVEIDDEDV